MIPRHLDCYLDVPTSQLILKFTEITLLIANWLIWKKNRHHCSFLFWYFKHITHTHTHTHIYIYIYRKYVCVCVCVWERERERERERDRQTDRQTDRDRDMCRYRCQIKSCNTIQMQNSSVSGYESLLLLLFFQKSPKRERDKEKELLHRISYTDRIRRE